MKRFTFPWGKKRLGLRSPRRLKRMIRWAIKRKSRVGYVAILSFPAFVGAVLATVLVFTAPLKKDVAPWLFHTQLTLAALLAWAYVVDGVMNPLRSWNRRHAP